MSAPTLRARKHVTQSIRPELETDDSFHYYDTSTPNSQLPSPVSDMENIDSDKEDMISPTSSKRRKSSSFTRARQTDTSDRMDIPLAVALIPPLGTFLTGGDFLRDSLLLLLLFFYLHQVRLFLYYKLSTPQLLTITIAHQVFVFIYLLCTNLHTNV